MEKQEAQPREEKRRVKFTRPKRKHPMERKRTVQ